MKDIILLNGPSSSGKSTLARALNEKLKEKIGEEYGIISIDDFLQMNTEDVIYEDDVYEISPQLCEKARKELEQKPGIIIDHVITSERIFQYIQGHLSDYNFYKIRVTCPVEVLNERERTRGNRCTGSAEASLEYLFPKEGYDLVIDTYKLSTEVCSERIIELLTK